MSTSKGKLDDYDKFLMDVLMREARERPSPAAYRAYRKKILTSRVDLRPERKQTDFKAYEGTLGSEFA